MAPKINCSMCSVRLPFLPGSPSALVAVFSAGLTFGFKPFLFLFVLFFLFIFFIFHYFSFIFVYYSLGLILKLFWSLSGPLWCHRSVWQLAWACRWFVVRSGLTATHLQALELVFVILPCPRLSFFRVFNLFHFLFFFIFYFFIYFFYFFVSFILSYF